LDDLNVVNAFYVDRALFDAKIRPAGTEEVEIEYVKKGTMLALQGDPLNTVDLLVGGQVRLSRVSADGRESSIAIVLGGDVLTTCPTSPYQVLAEVSAILARIPRSLFESLREKNRDFAVRIDRTLRRRSSIVEQRIEFSHRSPTIRVARALIEISEHFRGRTKLPRPTQVVIASFAGVIRETVSVEMSKLSRARAVSVSRKWIDLDLDRLRTFAGP